MSASWVDQIVTAAVAALNVASVPATLTKPALIKPSPLTVDTQRALPIDRATLPIMVVYPDGEVQTERVGTESSPLSFRLFRLKVDCWVSVVAGTPVYGALDPLFVWAVSALMKDQTLGGLTSGMQHADTEFDARLKGKIFGLASLGFHINYGTSASDPTA